jgi:hypothetical protein
VIEISILHFADASEAELQAAALSVKIYQTIKDELTYKVDQVTFWSDSQTTLQYIANETKRFHTYVANRVAEIREVTSPQQWGHCPGVLNPADDASRGLTPQSLSSQHRWWNGPEFLCKHEEFWPHAAIDSVYEEDLVVRDSSSTGKKRQTE